MKHFRKRPINQYVERKYKKINGVYLFRIYLNLSIFSLLGIFQRVVYFIFFHLHILMIVNCPHCSHSIEILEINCAIFRHGIFKDSYTQIDPHLCKDECEKLIKNNKIYGCGKPFKLIKENNTYIAVICEYI